MIFGEKSKNLAHFLLTAALLAASSATFAQTENFISREDRPHPSSGLDLSQEGILDSSNIHQAEVDSVLAEGISYSDAQRVADFPELLDLLNSESVHKKKIFASKSLLQRIESPRTAMSGSAFDQKSDFGNPLLFAFKNSESVKRFGSGCGHDRFDSLVGSSSSLRKKRKKRRVLP